MKKITIEAPGWELIDEIGWGTKTTEYNEVQAF
jgi:hypothetical protein